MTEMPTIRISPEKVALFLGALVVLVFLLALPAPIFRHGMGHDYVHGFVPFAERTFDLDRESNVPTWFSSGLLLLCSMGLLGVGLAERHGGRRYSAHWLVLAAIFVFLSLDETATLHEQAIALREVLGVGGALYYAWVIPGSIFVLGVGIAYLRFLRYLPPRTRNLFVAAGGVFIGGALGLEFIEGYYADLLGTAYGGSVTRILITYPQEVMEMAGCVILLYGVLDYARRHVGPVRIAASG